MTATAVKFMAGSETELEGLLLPFGGPHNGADLYGERFTKATDFCLPWSKGGDLPLLWHHGLDAEMEAETVGRIRKIEMRPEGGWMQAQLDASAKYFEQIRELVKAGKLFLSSGAMAHLVKVTKAGDIERWPVVEGSLTPTPANLLASVDFVTASKHYKSAGLELPEETQLADSDDSLKACSKQRLKEIAGELELELEDDELDDMMKQFPNNDEAAWQAALTTRKKMGKKSVPFSDIVSLILEDTGLDAESVPIGFHAEAITTLAASLVERTKGLSQRRIKEGRMISESNRKRLMTCMEQMAAAVAEMQGLLDSSVPQTAKAATLRRLRAQLIAQQISGMTLN